MGKRLSCPLLVLRRGQGARKAPPANPVPSNLGVRAGERVQAGRKPLHNRRRRRCFPQPTPLVGSSILQLVLGEEVLEELIDGPGDGSGRHLVDDAGLHAFEVPGQAVELVHCPEGVGHARQPAADVGQVEGHVLLSIEEGLTDVQRGGGGGGQGTGQPA